MKNIINIVFVCSLLLFFLFPALSRCQFVTRQGSKLFLNGKQFRCSGANVYWLGLDENVGGIQYPTHFRVDDALETAVEIKQIISSHHQKRTKWERHVCVLTH